MIKLTFFLLLLSICLDLFSFMDHLAVMFGEELPPWDADRKYHPQNLQVCMFTIVEQSDHTWWLFTIRNVNKTMVLNKLRSRVILILFLLHS